MDTYYEHEAHHVISVEQGLSEVDYVRFSDSIEAAVAKILTYSLIGVGKCGLAFNYWTPKENTAEEPRLVARLDCLNYLGRENTLYILESFISTYPQYAAPLNYLKDKFPWYYDEKYKSTKLRKNIKKAFEARIAGHNAFFRAFPQHGVPINTVLQIENMENGVGRLPLMTVTKLVEGNQLTDDSSDQIPNYLRRALSMGDPKLHNIIAELFLGSRRYAVIDIAKFNSSLALLELD